MSKSLVAYFSASGVTAKLASNLAQALEADLYEIEPEVKYTDADLNWRDKQSRSSIEMNDLSARPAIKSQVQNMAQYDRVYVGFPIWWYREPSIIDTFMESEDLAGKTVIPFATSGGSGIGDSAQNMQKLAPTARVVKGDRLSASMSIDELKSWASNG